MRISEMRVFLNNIGEGVHEVGELMRARAEDADASGDERAKLMWTTGLDAVRAELRLINRVSATLNHPENFGLNATDDLESVDIEQLASFRELVAKLPKDLAELRRICAQSMD